MRNVFLNGTDCPEAKVLGKFGPDLHSSRVKSNISVELRYLFLLSIPPATTKLTSPFFFLSKPEKINLKY